MQGGGRVGGSGQGGRPFRRTQSLGDMRAQQSGEAEGQLGGAGGARVVEQIQGPPNPDAQAAAGRQPFGGVVNPFPGRGGGDAAPPPLEAREARQIIKDLQLGPGAALGKPQRAIQKNLNKAGQVAEGLMSAAASKYAQGMEMIGVLEANGFFEKEGNGGKKGLMEGSLNQAKDMREKSSEMVSVAKDLMGAVEGLRAGRAEGVDEGRMGQLANKLETMAGNLEKIANRSEGAITVESLEAMLTELGGSFDEMEGVLTELRDSGVIEGRQLDAFELTLGEMAGSMREVAASFGGMLEGLSTEDRQAVNELITGKATSKKNITKLKSVLKSVAAVAIAVAAFAGLLALTMTGVGSLAALAVVALLLCASIGGLAGVPMMALQKSSATFEEANTAFNAMTGVVSDLGVEMSVDDRAIIRQRLDAIAAAGAAGVGVEEELAEAVPEARVVL